MSEPGRRRSPRTPGQTPDGHPPRPRHPVAVVLAGAGARGAYEAGFLATLLKARPPVLADELRPKIFIGTSAGAINAALFASLAHLPAHEMADTAVKRWRTITKQMVMRPALGSLAAAAARYGGGLVGLGNGPSALFDTAPLAASLADPELIDWPQVHANVRNGDVDVVAAVTSELGSGRTKVFYDSIRPDLQHVPPDADHAIDYVSTELEPEHVLASAAIPVAFPPVRLGPAGSATWHMDGGVRLNVPIKPALAFGANALVVIATDPPRYGTSAECESRADPPTMQEAVLWVMRSAMTDHMVQDVRDVLRTNHLLRKVAPGNGNGRHYRVVPLIFGGPAGTDDLGGVAARTLPDILRGLRAVSHPDLEMLYRLLSSNADSRAGLISYLLFEPEFIDGAINLGIQDATSLLDERPDPWQVEPVIHHIFDTSSSEGCSHLDPGR